MDGNNKFEGTNKIWYTIYLSGFRHSRELLLKEEFEEFEATSFWQVMEDIAWVFMCIITSTLIDTHGKY